MSVLNAWRKWRTVIVNPKTKKQTPYLNKVDSSSRKETGGEDLSALLNTAFDSLNMDRRDQSLATELVYGVFRQRGILDWYIDYFSRVKKIKRPTRYVLRLAIYQLLFLDRIPEYAAVNAAVEQTKRVDGISAGRFVNAVLRNLLRVKNKLPLPDPKNRVTFISLTTSHPEWMVRRWLDRMGEEKTLFFCQKNNEVPPMTLRVNLLKTTREQMVKDIETEGGTVSKTQFSPAGLIVKGLSVTRLLSFKQGAFYIQDEAAQLAAHLVNPQAGEQILDVCAAPGGKTTHLAELSDGKAMVTATDLHEGRLALLKENIDRLGTPGIQIEKMESALSAERTYDKILVDAPCSALGILRRIPEGKYWKTSDSIKQAAVTQLEILENVLPHLKTGGYLIYMTCSTEPEENESVAETFLNRHPELCVEDPSGNLPGEARKHVQSEAYFTTAFNSDKMDRFFGVRWLKKQ